MIEISELWHSGGSVLWYQALERYWKLIRPANETLERQMENLDFVRFPLRIKIGGRKHGSEIRRGKHSRSSIKH